MKGTNEQVKQPARRRTLEGVVVSDKMQKTIVVKVDRLVKHAAYGKYVVRSKKYKAHDESRVARVGDRVEIVETRPLSRDKRWAFRAVIGRSAQASGGEIT